MPKSFVKNKFAMIRCISGSKSAKFHYLSTQSLKDIYAYGGKTP